MFLNWSYTDKTKGCSIFYFQIPTTVPKFISFTFQPRMLNYVFSGNGFLENPEVKVGGKSCEVQSSDATTITCSIPVSEELSVSKWIGTMYCNKTYIFFSNLLIVEMVNMSSFWLYLKLITATAIC